MCFFRDGKVFPYFPQKFLPIQPLHCGKDMFLLPDYVSTIVSESKVAEYPIHLARRLEQV